MHASASSSLLAQHREPLVVGRREGLHQQAPAFTSKLGDGAPAFTSKFGNLVLSMPFSPEPEHAPSTEDRFDGQADEEAEKGIEHPEVRVTSLSKFGNIQLVGPPSLSPAGTRATLSALKVLRSQNVRVTATVQGSASE